MSRSSPGPGLPPSVISAQLGAVLATWPRLDLRLVINDEPFDPVALAADMALTWTRAVAPPGWTAVELVVAEDQLLASESYLAARAPIVAPEQLLEHTLFLWNSPDDAGPGVEVRGGV